MAPKVGDNMCLDCGGVNGHLEGCTADESRVYSIISAYSRVEAIEDGVLVDCTQPPFGELNRQAGILVHVAMTLEAFHSFVHPVDGGDFPLRTMHQEDAWQISPRTTELPPGQDMVGRYWDIISMLRVTAMREQDASCFQFRLHVVPNEGGTPVLTELKCVAGPDDDGVPCLTIMLPDQD